MFERLNYRLATTILICDIVATLLALRAAASLRLVLGYGRDIDAATVALRTADIPAGRRDLGDRLFVARPI